MNAQHLEDKVFLMGQGVIGKHIAADKVQEVQAEAVTGKHIAAGNKVQEVQTETNKNNQIAEF